MFHAYVIQSLNDGSYYKGHCENIDLRLKQHNAGKTKSIKSKVPFKVVYLEEFDNRESAIAREQYFKSRAGRRFLRTILVPIPTNVSETPDTGSLPE